MKAFVNPLLLVACILLLVFGASTPAESAGHLNTELWVMALCLVAVIVNGTLGLARACTQRPSLQSMGWAVVFLVFGSAVWALVSGNGEGSVSSQERAQLHQRVEAWQAGEQDAYALDENGDCVPVLAASLGKESILSQLLEEPGAVAAHAEVYARAAHRAAERNRVQVLQQLFAAGVPMEARVEGMTPLHAAAMVRAHRAAEFLLAQGAAVNAQDADGATPLHHAVLAEDEPMVRLLMQHGADPKLTDAEGRDAASYARTEVISEALAAPVPAEQQAS